MLVEYQQRGKVNQFVDKRFGENNAQLTLEEKMVTRFAEERKLKVTSGTNHFSLDDDEDGGELTHFGQSLSTMDEFDNIGLDIDEEEEGLIVPPFNPFNPRTPSRPQLILFLFSSPLLCFSSLHSLLFALFSLLSSLPAFFFFSLLQPKLLPTLSGRRTLAEARGKGRGKGRMTMIPTGPSRKRR